MSKRYQIIDPTGEYRLSTLVDTMPFSVIDTCLIADSDKYLEMQQECRRLNNVYEGQTLEERCDTIISALHE